ncbi:MAG: hypothetical protein RIR00_1209 [Pseudomonadota bacterium]
MRQLRPAAARGHADHGWLEARHSFSFADYYDPAEMGWSALRVINEDRVAPGAGFPLHGHRDMEIITWILSGSLAHRDSLGNGGLIRPGEFQFMRAGSGIRHSEMNPSPDTPVHLLQIWIAPSRSGLAPAYQQRQLDPAELANRLALLASPDGRDGSVALAQDASVYAARLAADAELDIALQPGRAAYLHLAYGKLTVDGQPLQAGDGLKLHDETRLALRADAASEFLLFDLPG